jgi:regulatory protein
VQDDASPPARQRGLAKLSLKGRALKLLSAREHSRLELSRKLAPHAEAPEQIERLLDELEALGYLSAQRVVESLIHRKAGRFGNARIRQEIHARGLDPAEHADTFETLRATEVVRARELWLRRFGGPSDDPRERARQSRFLLSRGFPGDVVARTVRGQGDPDPDDDAG